MPVLSRGVVARTFYPLAAACGLLLAIQTRTRTELGPTCVTPWKSLRMKDRLLCIFASRVRMIVLKYGSKRARFHLNMDHRVAPPHGTCLIKHPFAIL